MKNWMKAHLPPGKYVKGQLFYHAFTDLRQMIYAGEAGFRDLLVEAYKGKEPSPKVDVDNWTLPTP